MVIGSNSNEKVKELRKLVKSSKERRERGMYVVEGIKMFAEIPQEDILDIYVCESAMEKYGDRLHGNYTVLADHVFKSVSDTETPQGILALVKMKEHTLDSICIGDNPFILILERLQDPGNLGTIIRSAEAAGVSGIMLSQGCVDIYSPKVVRSTMGSLFRMPVFASQDLLTDIAKLKNRGVTIFGAHLNGDSMYNMNFTTPVAFLIGNEGKGLCGETEAAADFLLRIPMQGKVESLNAAVSASIIAYEVLRQRI
ncbi:MAG: RNA methyltransferase [Clostridium sp.]|nr:RNA methyltransferase [Clostridium sp.]MCM1400041.1 RNA methyltransferase [Clostridium sp.]MCM1459813.1 RNA methyltransferase [Bacteroides sp.]